LLLSSTVEDKIYFNLIIKGGFYMPYGYGGNGFLNPYTMIIVILIVLQWFRVGSGGAGVGTPEPGLLSCGGLFIIALFLLVYCACGRGPIAPIAPVAGARYC
jgi:hypothetical protein